MLQNPTLIEHRVADMLTSPRHVRFTPEERTCSASASMSAKCHKRTLHHRRALLTAVGRSELPPVTPAIVA